MAGSSVNNGRVVRILAIMNQDSPDVDTNKQEDIGKLGKREQEREDVIGQTLGIAVQWMESVRGIGSRHDPLVVWLVDVLVNERVVEIAVNPVDERVGEEEEKGKLHVVVPQSRTLVDRIV